MYYLRLENAYIYEAFRSIKKIKEFLQGNTTAHGFIDEHKHGLCVRIANIKNGAIIRL